jgi:hypothetical protein
MVAIYESKKHSSPYHYSGSRTRSGVGSCPLRTKRLCTERSGRNPLFRRTRRPHAWSTRSAAASRTGSDTEKKSGSTSSHPDTTPVLEALVPARPRDPDYFGEAHDVTEAQTCDLARLVSSATVF